MSSLVDQFFRPEAHQGLPTLQPGVYTKTQLASLYNNDSYGINFQQYDYQDSIDDLAERTWTWNSTAIKLADDVQFVVDANGNRFIDNYYLVPRYNSENFDFDTNDFLLNITADYVQDLMDLSRIGRTVEIEFTGGVSSRITYTLQDFQNDRNLESQQFNPTPNLLPKINDLLDQLWDSDITQFVHEGKPVLYGTKGDDLLLAKKVEENSYFSDELEQDVHLIGGDGNDLLLGMKGRDRLDGGKDNDVLLGGGNEDQLQNIENANQFDLASQYFASDEDKDILNGGLGDDTYYILSTQKVLSNSINWGDQSASGNPLSHFDVVFTWEDGSNAAQKSFDPSTVPNIDSIIDEDGKGEILLNTRDIDSNARLFKFSNPGQLLKLQDGVDINIGWDVYVKNDGSGEDVFFIQDGQKLYGFSGVLAEAGAGYADHWGGLHAHFVIEDFSDGDFGIDLAGAEPMSSGGTGGPGSGSGASGGSGGSNTNGGGAGPGWAISSAAFHSPVISPLVFDLDGDGLETITLDNATAYFDLDNDGFAEKTAWIAPDDGFLAYDANGNGTIDDNSELFGSGDVDGFSILAAHDSNGDGLINASDTIFNDLRVWQDANGDGVSASGELISLTQAGITEINLSADYVDNWIDAGWISHSSGYTQTSGATGTIYDIWFENDQMLSVDRNGTSVTITNPDVLALPDLAGYGTVTDLQIALNSDDALRLELKALVEGSVNLTQAELWSQAEAFLLKWVGVDQIATGSRGQHVDAQHLEFLEALHGVDFEAVGGASDPGYRAGADLEIYYTTVINSYIAKLIIQIPDALSALSGDPADGATSFYASFASLNYQVDSDSLSGDFSAVLTEIKDDLAQQSAGGNIDGFLRHMEIFSALRTDLGNSDAAFTGWLSLKMMFGGFEQQYVMIAREILETTGILSGTTGSDTIDGTILNDFVYGAVGDDTLSGGTGNDVYLYNLGDGADVISDGYLSGNADKLLLGIGIVPNEVTITRSSTNPDDVTLTFSDGGTVLLKEQVRQGDGFGVEEIIFVDGTTWTDATIREMLLAASQTDGDDSVLGYNGEDDTLQGGLGNDNLDGLQGDDTYVYSLGDGADTISEGFNAGTADKLQLGAGILPVEVTVTRSASNPDDVTLTFSDGGTILLKEQVRQGSGFGVEEIIFDDGTIWTKATIRSMVLSASQTDGDDTVLGFNGEDDTLEGGLGNDDLDGLQGDDTYIYSLGDGADTISEGYNSGTVDKLQLGASILPAEVTVTRSVIDPDDVTLTMSDGGTILLKEQVRQGSDYGVEEIIFDDGTIWTKATLQTMLIAAS
ncbi:MAG: calcium-binding protein, partial [Stappiaceae bacterium]